MNRIAPFVSAALVTLLIANCGGSDGDGNVSDAGPSSTVDDSGNDASGDSPLNNPDTAPSVSIDTACSDLADSFCGKYASCSATSIAVTFGDLATCKARAIIGCKATLSAPQTGTTPDRIETCAKIFPNSTCADAYALRVPPECKPVSGGIANGGGCEDDSQCVSAFCGKQKDTMCGICGDAPAAGAACFNGGCVAGMVCESNNTCQNYGSLNAACNSNLPCELQLSCVSGHCVADADHSGASCDIAATSNPECDATLGLVCGVLSHQCGALTIANAGSSCGLGITTFAVCNASAYCHLGSQGALSGTCATRAQDGSACNSNAWQGPQCLAPATCTAGICTLPDPQSCSVAGDAGPG